MTRLFVSPNISEVLLLKNLIENEGIETFIRNEHLSIASGAVPFTECMPELWVSEPDLAAAGAIMGRWQNGAEEELEAWTCPSCGEIIEAQFGQCWKCGHVWDGDDEP